MRECCRRIRREDDEEITKAGSRRMKTVSVVHRDRFQDLLAHSAPCIDTGSVNQAAMFLRETLALALDLNDKTLVDDCRKRLH